MLGQEASRLAQELLMRDLVDERIRAMRIREALPATGIDHPNLSELFARLRALFDEAQIVELTAAVALENFRSKFNVPLQVESQGFCLIK